MSATFKQPEISVREELNSLPQYENLTPEEMGTGTDIGGGETLWGDGSITGSNSNGTYTKWPNGDLECRGITGSITTSTLVSGVYNGSQSVVSPHLFIKTYTLQATAVAGTGRSWPGGVFGFNAHNITLNLYSNVTGQISKIEYLATGTWK